MINAQCITTNVLFGKLFIIVGMVLINVLIIELSIQPTNIIVTALDDVTLTCSTSTVSENTSIEYSWHRVDGDIPAHSSGQNTSTLTLHRIVPADEGEYYCMGTMHGHCANSKTVNVRVNGKETTVPHMYNCLAVVNFDNRITFPRYYFLHSFRHVHFMLRNNGIKESIRGQYNHATYNLLIIVKLS